MPFNIDTFKVKKLENLRIPVASLYKHPRSDWHPEETVDRSVTPPLHNFEMTGAGTSISGHVIDGILYVVSIECSGEGSGTSMDWIIEPALEDSRGEFVASCIRGEGEEISKIEVKDGVVAWTDVEI
jgi:hypothetical protein